MASCTEGCAISKDNEAAKQQQVARMPAAIRKTMKKPLTKGQIFD